VCAGTSKVLASDQPSQGDPLHQRARGGKPSLLLIHQVLDVAGFAVLLETGKTGKRLGLAVAEQINRCMKSEHYQVAERALLIWNNPIM